MAAGVVRGLVARRERERADFLEERDRRDALVEANRKADEANRKANRQTFKDVRDLQQQSLENEMAERGMEIRESAEARAAEAHAAKKSAPGGLAGPPRTAAGRAPTQTDMDREKLMSAFLSPSHIGLDAQLPGLSNRMRTILSVKSDEDIASKNFLPDILGLLSSSPLTDEGFGFPNNVVATPELMQAIALHIAANAEFYFGDRSNPKAQSESLLSGLGKWLSERSSGPFGFGKSKGERKPTPEDVGLGVR
jgi:hypothetical protein